LAIGASLTGGLGRASPGLSQKRGRSENHPLAERATKKPIFCGAPSSRGQRFRGADHVPNMLDVQQTRGIFGETFFPAFEVMRVMSADFEEVNRLVVAYFDALYTGDHVAMATLFHRKAKIYNFKEGKLSELDIDSYVEIVKNRASPLKLQSARKDEILSVSITTPVSATAIVRLILFKNDFTDQLSFIKDEGRWSIMTKIYHLNGILD